MRISTLFFLFVLLTTPWISKAQITDNGDVSSQEIDTTISIPPVPIEHLDSSYRMVYDTIHAIQNSYKQNAVAIYHLLQGREVSNLSKYELVKSNLVSCAGTYLLLNKAINGLRSGFATDSLDLFVDSLNSPGNKELGVSFDERVVDLVKSIVLRGKTGNKRSKRIIKSITFMVNDSLFKNGAKITPPVEIISSVMTLLRSTAIDDNRISPARLDKLEQELNKYVIYYAALSDGKQQFNYGLSVIKDELTTLQKNIYIQLRFIANNLDIPLSGWMTQNELSKSLDDFFVHFTKPYMQNYLEATEQKYTFAGTKQINYTRLLRENSQIKEINNQLDDLILQIKKFDNIDNEYFTLLDSYYAQIVKALNTASDSGLVSQQYIKIKQKQLAQLKVNEIKKTKDSVNLKGLITNTPYIKYRYKVF